MTLSGGSHAHPVSLFSPPGRLTQIPYHPPLGVHVWRSACMVTPWQTLCSSIRTIFCHATTHESPSVKESGMRLFSRVQPIPAQDGATGKRRAALLMNDALFGCRAHVRVPMPFACRCVVSALPPGSVEECAAPSVAGRVTASARLTDRAFSGASWSRNPRVEHQEAQTPPSPTGG